MRQELSCRCKKQGASGNLAAPSRTNPARLHQNVKRSSCYLHAAYGLYLSAADRLVIGDDSQRFHGCTRKLARFLPRSEEHTSELQSLMRSSYAVFCLKNKRFNSWPLPPKS